MTQITKSESFHGFKVVKLKFCVEDNLQTRDIFVQQHSIRRSSIDKPSGRTLFIVNIPPYIHENELRFAYADVGEIQSIMLVESVIERKQDLNEAETVELSSNQYFNKTKPISKFKAAYVVFKSTRSLQLALAKSEICMYKKKSESVLCTGIEKWKKEHDDNIINEKKLEKEVNYYMKCFGVKEHKAREEAKKAEVDADGWVTVKRGKNSGFEQKESILKALEEKIEKGKKKKQFDNFYSFQIRESKRKHIVNLRKKFGEDKLKIEALKKARRFKPF